MEMPTGIWTSNKFIFIFRSLLITIVILFFLFLLERSLQKSLRPRRFKSDRDEILQQCSSSKYASTDEVGFSTWHLTSHFQDGGHDVISRHKMLPPVEWTRSVCRRLWSSVRPFLTMVDPQYICTLFSFMLHFGVARDHIMHLAWSMSQVRLLSSSIILTRPRPMLNAHYEPNPGTIIAT